MEPEPESRLGPRYSDKDATTASWPDAVARLEQAELFWLTTVRPDGRPHVTPLLAVRQDDALYFCTGPSERKAKNLAANRNVVLTTGTNTCTRGSTWWSRARRCGRPTSRACGAWHRRTRRSTARTGTSTYATGRSRARARASAPWRSASPLRRPSASARASTARPAGSSAGLFS